MSEPLLELVDVTVRFGGTVAVDGLSLQLQPGRVTSLIGPNGAGKTTAVSVVAGVRPPDAGVVRYRGRPLPAAPHRAGRLGIGRLFQDVRVFGSLTALENVLVAQQQAVPHGVWAPLLTPRRVARAERAAREHAREQLAFVGADVREDAPAGSLSYGQQKLVAIARLLAQGADLLLLDEPASGVNPKLVERLAGLVRRLAQAGRTVLLVEHNMGLVRQVSDEVVLLDRGRCRAAGPADEVWASGVLREVYYAPPEP